MPSNRPCDRIGREPQNCSIPTSRCRCEYRRGKGSGLEVETDTAVVFTVRDGRVVGIQGYIDPVAALEAAGLPD